MADIKEVRIPDIGDFTDVEVIEVLVSEGDSVSKDDSLITLESDKASMDIPAPFSGKVASVMVHTGERVSEGTPVMKMEVADNDNKNDKATSGKKPATPEKETADDTGASKAPATQAAPRPSPTADKHCEVLVLGAGPGGYTAAFRAADLGKQVILVERYATLGGVCLNVGCIPSKALLHVAKVISEIAELKDQGIDLGGKAAKTKPLRAWTEGVVGKLTAGLAQMAKQRKVEVVHGTGKFTSANTMEISNGKKTISISFEHAVIAAGSQAAKLPDLPDDPRILDSTSALLLEHVPERLLVIGGGIIGLEMATVYDALGSKITIVEMLDNLITGCDKDIVRPLQKRIKSRYENIFLKTSVEGIKAGKNSIEVSFSGKDAPAKDQFDAVLVAVGRTPNGKKIGAEAAGIQVDERGFIPVDDQQRSNVSHIFAIGDITGQPMLAHKASHEGKVAAEVIAGHKTAFLGRKIPSVAYTDPEIAWVGVTETEAKEQRLDYGKGVFPWAASGRSLSLGRDEGITKLIFDKTSKQIIGAAIVGPNAGELIAECTLAIEMGADAEDIGLTIHPHPTLTETVGMAAEAFEGTITDLYMPKK